MIKTEAIINNVMASRIVRKIKRKANSIKETLPSIVVTPPDLTDMKVKAKNQVEDKNDNVTKANINEAEMNEASTSQVSAQTMAGINVSQLIAELSENSRASKGEIENIQRRLLHQANEILKVNAFANHPVPEPRIVDSTQKYSNKPVYGRIPVLLPRNNVPNQALNQGIEISRQNLTNPNMAALKADVRPDNQLETQLVPEKLQESLGNGAMINGAQGNMQRVAMPVDAGRVFFYETGSAGRSAASARAAPTRGKCLVHSKFQIILNSFFIPSFV